jgi:predicted dehydrogenase
VSHGRPARFGLIGTGWRSEYFARIAAALPEYMSIGAVTSARPESAKAFGRLWGLDVAADVDDLLARDLEFVLVSVPRTVAPELIRAAVSAGKPVLTETPPAAGLDDLHDLYGALGHDSPVQVAEQYQFQPHHAARIELARSGLIGPVSSARVSAAHGYHGVSLIRFLLGIGFDEVAIRAAKVPDRLLSGNGRYGWTPELAMATPRRTVAQLDVDGTDAQAGLFDFDDEQYYSPIRSRHVSVSGEKGEISDLDVSRWIRPGHAITEPITRDVTGVDGDLDGSTLRRLRLGERVVWSNEFGDVRLSDDELAGARALVRMAAFTRGGEGFYGLADGCHDHYLSLLIDAAAASGATVRSEPQPWSGRASATAAR